MGREGEKGESKGEVAMGARGGSGERVDKRRAETICLISYLEIKKEVSSVRSSRDLILSISLYTLPSPNETSRADHPPPSPSFPPFPSPPSHRKTTTPPPCLPSSLEISSLPSNAWKRRTSTSKLWTRWTNNNSRLPFEDSSRSIRGELLLGSWMRGTEEG